ncbi:hypothetical protein PR048_014965 [Dryococelus australis]|uniref:DUF5641 domain-containing protein n=1 Tax=Dryococelus australis TaxID=614101 RepID=A0ABQ9HFL6_9NEOP|nr:hypothetical protein PR048_014965 [Dryococelus australis]
MFIQDYLIVEVPDIDRINEVSLSKGRFLSKYLSQLLQHPYRNKTLCLELKIGDVVIIGSDDKKRINWPLARIIAVYPCQDGVISVVRVKT